MSSPALQLSRDIDRRRFGLAWLLFVATLVLHVTDEALTGFLNVYNPTVIELRQRVSWLRFPTFSFEQWLVALCIGICLLLLLTPLAYAAPRWIRTAAIPLAVVLCIINACGHLAGTVAGRTFSDITFARPAPGTYSSPLLLAAGVNLIFAARRSRPR